MDSFGIFCFSIVQCVYAKSMPTDELAFRLGGKETGVIALLFLHRLLLLRYVIVVGHVLYFSHSIPRKHTGSFFPCAL